MKYEERKSGIRITSGIVGRKKIQIITYKICHKHKKR
uniref:Uncharacterized protein n=1 Tax=Anguilla anguilla TaxID=7936 RepID=A0A0E9WIN5_ANGAN